MGIYQDLLDNPKSFKAADPLGRFLQRQIESKVDPANPAVAAVTNAVHAIAQSTQTSGNMTLTVTLRSGETFTTGSIAFDALAAAVETAIDVAATAASITGWTNGDISVGGVSVDGVAGLTLTFDGTSVAGANHPISVVTDVDGAGGAWGAVSLTTAGQSIRRAMGALIALGILDSSTFPEQSDPASNSAYAIASEDRYNKFPGDIVTSLAREMAAEDGNNDSYHSLTESLGIQDKAPKAQYLGGSSVV